MTSSPTDEDDELRFTRYRVALDEGPLLYVTRHAIDRWRERVDPSATRREARRALTDLARVGRVTDRPPRWMPHARARPGSLYVRHPRFPDLYAVIRRKTIVTVISRQSPKETTR